MYKSKSSCTNNDIVEKGDTIIDGSSTDKGELSLGANILVGFLSFGGYNFEDAIIISERLVHEDIYTSIHIKELEVIARDVRLGSEEITRDIVDVKEELLKDLDESGIVYIGTKVKPHDILVGKVTPKIESPVTPEEKLLKAIFGEKSTEVRNTSLYVPAGIEGTVVDVRIFTRRGYKKSERANLIENNLIKDIVRKKRFKFKYFKRIFRRIINKLILNQKNAKSLDIIKAKEISLKK